MSVFVAIEGIDGCGKSTLCANLAAHYTKGANFIRFPRREGPFSRAIYGHLTDPHKRLEPSSFALLAAADRKDGMYTEEFRAESKRLLVSDRYLHSGIAYAIAAGVSPDFAVAIEAEQTMPDLVIYIDLPVGEAQARIASRHRIQGEERVPIEDADYQTEVKQAFEYALESIPGVKVVCIDGRLSTDEVFQLARAEIEAVCASIHGVSGALQSLAVNLI